MYESLPGLGMTTVCETLKAEGQCASMRHVFASERKASLNSSSLRKAFSNRHDNCEGPGADVLLQVLIASVSSAFEKG